MRLGIQNEQLETNKQHVSQQHSMFHQEEYSLFHVGNRTTTAILALGWGEKYQDTDIAALPPHLLHSSDRALTFLVAL